MRLGQFAIIANEFPCFQLRFEFLNTSKSHNNDQCLDEAPVSKKKRFLEVTETERKQLLVETQARTTKSATNWAVNVFKGKEM